MIWTGPILKKKTKKNVYKRISCLVRRNFARSPRYFEIVETRVALPLTRSNSYKPWKFSAFKPTAKQQQQALERSKKQFFCPRCSSGFTMESNMMTHYRHLCGREPRFGCPYCEKRDKKAYNIYRHVARWHPGLKNYTLKLHWLGCKMPRKRKNKFTIKRVRIALWIFLYLHFSSLSLICCIVICKCFPRTSPIYLIALRSDIQITH